MTPDLAEAHSAHGHQFAETHWSVVLAATRADASESMTALGALIFGPLRRIPLRAFDAATRLCQLCDMKAAFFTNSGTEAVECALKLARKARPGRERIVVFERSFHGVRCAAPAARCWRRS